MPELSLSDLFTCAVQLCRATRLAEAEKILDYILDADPHHAASLHLRGVISFQHGQKDRAIGLIEQAIAVNHTVAEFHHSLGTVFQTMNRPNDAVRSFQRALALKPDHIPTLLKLGGILHETGRAQEAIVCYEQLLVLQPNDATVLNNLGNLLQSQGRTADAVDRYKRALSLLPDQSEFLNNLGNALREQGEAVEAISAFERALIHKPDYVEALSNLGNALQDQGRLDDAVVRYRRALAIRPDFPQALCNLGNALRRQGHLQEAVLCCQKALALVPKYPDALVNLGNALLDQVKLDEAAACYRQALALRPNFPDVLNNLAHVLREQGKLKEALFCSERALALKPKSPDVLVNLGNVLRDQDQPELAIARYQEALALRPDYPEALDNCGNALEGLGRLDEAITFYRQALSLKPDYAQAYNNLAVVLQQQGKLDDAFACYRQAIALKPDFPKATFNLSLAHLLRGDYASGWPLYEWRWRAGATKLTPPNFVQPRWTGQDIKGRTLLIQAEQGIGDTIQFCRYVPLATTQADVVLEVQRPLVSLLAQLPGVKEIVAHGDPLPPFDFHCPLLSLPGIFNTTPETIPASVPYLRADPQRQAVWLDLLPKAGLRIGIAWVGNPTHHVNPYRNRAIPLAALAKLMRNDGLTWHVLQINPSEGDHDIIARTPSLFDHSDRLIGFAETAALASLMDLIISVDTSIAHLAGALGLPTWLMLPYAADWRWFENRNDSPWYPTLRLFRQSSPGAWGTVITAICEALRQFVNLELLNGGQP